ncbi:PTS fructose transporter subunit IIA [Oenococcus oeni]|nr:PTS fructose transporter subunit IIA [Oenococcus oeni]TEU56303.1 PTS fructose transporter subunit IIA [Oenococcus oeni]TEU58236.1 PTS fructose transporter subunit IIA [Oenococcus oeni]
MKYLLLVSHGDFSKGLKSSLAMFASASMSSVIAVGLKPDESADTFGEHFQKLLKTLPKDSQFIVLADIIGGSPLTTVCNVLSSHGKLDDGVVLGGMNFPMALSALLSKDSMDADALKKKVLSEASSSIKAFAVQFDESSEDDI